MELWTWLPWVLLIVLLAIAVPFVRHLKQRRPDLARNVTFFCGGFIACHLLERAFQLIVTGSL